MSLPDSNACKNSCTLTWPRKSGQWSRRIPKAICKETESSWLQPLHHQLALRCNVIRVFKKGSSTAPLWSSSITFILPYLATVWNGKKTWMQSLSSSKHVFEHCDPGSIKDCDNFFIWKAWQHPDRFQDCYGLCLTVWLSDPVKRCSSYLTSSVWNHIVISMHIEADLNFLHSWKLHPSTICMDMMTCNQNQTKREFKYLAFARENRKIWKQTEKDRSRWT